MGPAIQSTCSNVQWDDKSLGFAVKSGGQGKIGWQKSGFRIQTTVDSHQFEQVFNISG